MGIHFRLENDAFADWNVHDITIPDRHFSRRWLKRDRKKADPEHC